MSRFRTALSVLVWKFSVSAPNSGFEHQSQTIPHQYTWSATHNVSTPQINGLRAVYAIWKLSQINGVKRRYRVSFFHFFFQADTKGKQEVHRPRYSYQACKRGPIEAYCPQNRVFLPDPRVEKNQVSEVPPKIKLESFQYRVWKLWLLIFSSNQSSTAC